MCPEKGTLREEEPGRFLGPGGIRSRQCNMGRIRIFGVAEEGPLGGGGKDLWVEGERPRGWKVRGVFKAVTSVGLEGDASWGWGG